MNFRYCSLDRVDFFSLFEESDVDRIVCPNHTVGDIVGKAIDNTRNKLPVNRYLDFDVDDFRELFSSLLYYELNGFLDLESCSVIFLCSEISGWIIEVLDS